MNALYVLPLLVVIGMVLIIGSLYLLDNLLIKIIKPNKQYLNEIKELKTTKITSVITKVMIILLITLQSLERTSILILIVIFLVESIGIKFNLNYLDNKEENKPTKKYLIFNHGILFIALIGAILFNIFIYK